MGTGAALWALTALYAAGRLLHLVQDRAPLIVVVAVPIFMPLVFTLIHGARIYGIRGILTFVALCLLVGNVSENLGIRTGLPFGDYYFTGVMGPKLLGVPILLGLAYVGMGYLSWILGCRIVGNLRSRVAAPLLAAMIMVSWDLSLDPVWSTVYHGWVWRHGGPWFGVPLLNFFGWYLTVYVIYQLFALYGRGLAPQAASVSGALGSAPAVFYAAAAAGNLLLAAPLARFEWVSDPAGQQWRVSHIFIACAGVSIVLMGGFALAAWALPRVRAASAL